MDGASTNTVPSYNPTAGYPPLAHSNSSPSNHQHSSSHLPVAAVAQPLHASGGYPGLAGHSLHALGDHAYPVQAQAQAQVQSASMQPVYAQATATATPTSASSSAVVAQKPSSAADTAATAYPSAQQPQQGVRRQVSGGLPALPSSFPELDQLTSIQLQRLLTDQVALEVCSFIFGLLSGL